MSAMPIVNIACSGIKSSKLNRGQPNGCWKPSAKRNSIPMLGTRFTTYASTMLSGMNSTGKRTRRTRL